MNLLCRICLFKVEPTNSTNIFIRSANGELISEIIINFASVEVSEEDELPKLICSGCLQKLHDSYEFKHLIVTSDLHIREINKSPALYPPYLYEQKQLDSKEFANSFQEHVLPSEKVCVKNEHFTPDVDILNHIENISDFIKTEEIKETVKKKVKVRNCKPRIHCCKECNETFRSRYSLATHQIKHTDITPFSCDVCDKKFPTSWSLHIHKKKHLETKGHHCHICGKSFKYPSSLTIHTKKHQGIRLFKCTNCVKDFFSLQSLQAHEVTHTRERNFICEFCSKTCLTSSGLLNHRKIHTNPITVPCPICGKSYTHLGNHLKTHSGEKPFSCSVCQKNFSTRPSLKIHMRIHDDVKPFSCDICGKTFRQRGVAKLHQRVHTGETPFPCTVCKRQFGYKHHLKKHMQKDHSEQTAE